MGELMMVEKGAPVLEGVDLPLFYMNDFSVLGLVVQKLSQALKVLKTNGFTVTRQNNCARIRFHTRSEMDKLFETLNRHHVAYGTADLARQMYQG